MKLKILQPLPRQLNRIPNQPPLINSESSSRIAIIGDCPPEAGARAPFVGATYGMLTQICQAAGFDLKECFWGNLLDSYPPDGKFILANEADRAEAKQRLFDELTTFNPTVIIALTKEVHDVLKHNTDRYSDFDDERGAPYSVVIGESKVPVIPTLHPRGIFKRFEYLTVVTADFKKAGSIALLGWQDRRCQINFTPSFSEIMMTLNRFIELKPYLSVDIETKNAHISCIGFAWSNSQALVIPFDKERNVPCWSLVEERILWQRIAAVLSSCRLVGQNCMHFDRKHLLKHYKVWSNYVDDTMFAAWECYPELPKSLAFLNSLYTQNAYHKDILSQARSGKVHYTEEYRYCGLDCCYTYEIMEKLAAEIKERPAGVYSHYRFNIRVSEVFDYMSASGSFFDSAKRDKRVKELSEQAAMDVLSIRREIGSAFNGTFNVRSPKQVSSYLYETLKLPKKYKLTFTDEGEEKESLTSDYLTILYFARLFPQYPVVLKIGQLRKLYKRISSLNKIRLRADGKVGWDFVVPGTVTGRASGKKPMDGLGLQPQNVDRDDRDLFLAGEGNLWMKADLEGADSWTCAAMLASLGEDTLMNDLLAGLKPAQTLAIALLEGESLIGAPQATLLDLKQILKTPHGKHTYRFCKNVGHGSAYGMRSRRMHETIFKESDGEVYITPQDCERYQKLFYKRYNFPALHDFCRARLNKEGFLDSASGTRRYFLGRKDDSTLRDLLAHAPQAHTSFIANTVLDRIGSSVSNRRNRELILKPISQVHDETNLIFRQSDTDFAVDLFHSNCHVPLDYWGSIFTIPFEVGLGEDWGNCTEMVKV